MHHDERSTAGAARWLALAALMVGSNVWAQASGLPPEILRYADTVYVNARIITLDEHDVNPDPGTIAEAMAVRDEIILALGSDEEMLRMAGPDTRIVDLEGKTVIPGFVESHVHPMSESERFAREQYKLRTTPEGYVLRMDIAATTDETMAKVARAMDLLLAHATPTPEEWLNIELLHAPALGFATPASVSTLMSAPQLSDVRITRADISEIVPNYPLVLSSATGIMDAPEDNVWFHVTAGPDGRPVTTRIVSLDGRVE
jgi:cytosine/adenosine deaminase-related metal-dependent hydrolase